MTQQDIETVFSVHGTIVSTIVRVKHVGEDEGVRNDPKQPFGPDHMYQICLVTRLAARTSAAHLGFCGI